MSSFYLDENVFTPDDFRNASFYLGFGGYFANEMNALDAEVEAGRVRDLSVVRVDPKGKGHCYGCCLGPKTYGQMMYCKYFIPLSRVHHNGHHH